VTGPLTLSVVADYTNAAVGSALNLTALIAGRTTGSAWDFGDGTIVSNRPYASHAWAATGDYLVTLRAYNESLPAGVATYLTIHVVKSPTLYVAAASTNPQPPYTSWATAATSIQDAVNATTVAGALVLVSNGVYAGGLEVTTPLALRSINGPEFTAIDGGGTNRCANLATGVSLTGFTLTNGFASGYGNYGGGVCCPSLDAFLTNCVIVGNLVFDSGGGAYGCTLYDCALTYNAAYNESGGGGGALFCALYNCTLSTNYAYYDGGGAYGCTLYNSTLTGNYAVYYGGGAYESTLYSCTLSTNSAGLGGGASGSTLYNCRLTGNFANIFGGGVEDSTACNCTLTGNSARQSCGGSAVSRLNNSILYFNTAPVSENHDIEGPSIYGYSAFNYCSTTPMPTNGVGNITNAPLFVDDASGNLRLQANSPCINSGNNAYVATSTDLDANPRIVSGMVDIGAYEHQGAGSVISYAWLQQYGLPMDGSADYTDPDHDSMNNWQEWRCGTDPTNPLSALRLLSAAPVGTNVAVTWQSVAGVSYFLERSTNLALPFGPLSTNITGNAGTTTYSDTNVSTSGPLFYRVGVGN
jgi:hypothetical protein